MKTIHKTELLPGINRLLISQESTFLHIGIQDNRIMLWYITYTIMPREDRTISLVGTGFDISKIGTEKYIGTVIDLEGYVWHAFEV